MKPAFAQHFEAAQPITPDPLPLTGETAPIAPFPVEALGPVLEKATRAIMKQAFVPAQTAVQSILSAASLALQPHFNVHLPTRQVRPVSLFMVTIAKSGARKSTSDDIALAEVGEYQRELAKQHQADSHGEAAKRMAWDAAKAHALTSAKSKGADAIEQALNDLGPKPAASWQPALITRTGTTQGLLKFYDVARPSLGLMSDEGGSWLGGYGMTEDNKLNTIATLSDLWDGKPIQRMTSGEGMTVLYGRRLTFHLMIQPVLAGRLLGDAEAKGQGFLSRLLVTQPESLAGQRIVDPVTSQDVEAADAMRAYHERLGRVLRAKLPIDPDNGALQPVGIEMTEQALLMWWAFYNELERRIGPGGDLEEVDGFVGKLPEQAARIAVVLAGFEHGLRLERIDADQMARGIAIAEFYLSEAVRLFGVAPIDPVIAEAQLLSDWLRDKWPENLISIRRIAQVGPGQLRKLGSDRLKLVVEALVRHNHLGPRLPNGGAVSGKHAQDAWRVLWPRQNNG